MYTQFIFPSSTQAHKARRILSRNGIPSDLQKITRPDRGCVFALTIKTAILRDGMKALKENGIPFEIGRG